MTPGISTASGNPAVGREWRTSLVWLAAVFAISRAAYALAGVRFDARPLSDFFQLLDLDLLRPWLLESIFYMHFNAPAFN